MAKRRLIGTSLATAGALALGLVGAAPPTSAAVTPLISGRVTEAGSPADGVAVTALRDAGGGAWEWVDTVLTDATGQYVLCEFRCENGSLYLVRFSKGGWRTEYYDNAASIGAATAVPVVADGDPGALQYRVDADLALGPTVEDLSGPLVPADLASSLAGPGVTVSNVAFTGDERAAGQFQRFVPLGFSQGVVLSSGLVSEVLGPNDSSGTGQALGQPGDPDLTTLIDPSTTKDAAVLTLDFVPSTSQVRFSYVFGSEEYNEFVGSFDDVFAFLINGSNCAVVPGTTSRVSVNTINLNSHASLYRDNDFGAASPYDIEMDGLTVPLTCVANVNQGQTNTLKLTIADANDGVLDSVVFLQQDSLKAHQPPTAAGQAVSTAQGLARAITLGGSDPDGDPLTFAVASGPSHGALSGTAPNLTYTPAAGYLGPDSFTFTVDDGAATSAAATVSITVNPVDDPPSIGQPGLAPLPTVIKRYSKYKRSTWLKTPAVRLPSATTLGQPVAYKTLTKSVCKPVLTKGIWRIKGTKGGTCRIRAVAAATPTAAALTLVVKVKVLRKGKRT